MRPAGKGRKVTKEDASDATSEVVTDEKMAPPALPKKRVHHTKSEGSLSVVDAGSGRRKGYKLERVPATAAAPAVVDADMDGPLSLSTMVAAASASANSGSGRESRRKKLYKGEKVQPNVSVADMRKVTDACFDVIFDAKLPTEVTRKLLDETGKYEDLLMKLIVENERLKDKLDVFQSASPVLTTPSQQVPIPRTPGAGVRSAVAPVDVPAVPKPVETRSVVVRGKGKASTSKEVVSKVVEQVEPTPGMRVHALKTIRGGGAVIRTPSVAEREKMCV